MRAFKSSTAPLPTGLSSYVARSYSTNSGTFRVSLPREIVQGKTSLIFARTVPQHGSFDPMSLQQASPYPASAPRRRNTAPSSWAYNRHLLPTYTMTRQSPLALRSSQRLRPFHHLSKKDQYQSQVRSKYSPYRAESVTLFYRAVQLTFLGTFFAIYLALQDESQPKRTHSIFQKRQPPPSSTLESIQQHLTSVRESIGKHLTYQDLSYRPKEWPPSDLKQCTPYVGHIFAHESASHLAVNSLSFYFLTSFLFPSMGVLTAAATFLAGGVMASQIDCATAHAYANLRNPWHNIVARLHVSPRDPNPNRTLGTSRLGASAGLCTLFTVAAISSPFSRMSFMFVPIGIPMWVLWGGEVAWEGYSFYNNVDDGIGHGGHLAGHLAGAILWLVAVRWTSYGKLCRQVRWPER
jgi:membrane associated rhomboid family serine protease